MAEGLKLCKSVEKKLLKRNTKMRRAFYERFKKKVRMVGSREVGDSQLGRGWTVD